MVDLRAIRACCSHNALLLYNLPRSSLDRQKYHREERRKEEGGTRINRRAWIGAACINSNYWSTQPCNAVKKARDT